MANSSISLPRSVSAEDVDTNGAVTLLGGELNTDRKAHDTKDSTIAKITIQKTTFAIAAISSTFLPRAGELFVWKLFCPVLVKKFLGKNFPVLQLFPQGPP
jgi:hypothetical protein